MNLLQAGRTQYVAMGPRNLNIANKYTRSAIFQMKGTIDLLSATFSPTHVNHHNNTAELLPSPPPPYQGLESGKMALAQASRVYNDICSRQVEEPHESVFASRFRTETCLKSIDADLGSPRLQVHFNQSHQVIRWCRGRDRRVLH